MKHPAYALVGALVLSTPLMMAQPGRVAAAPPDLQGVYQSIPDGAALPGGLKNAGSPEVLAARLCLISEKRDAGVQGIFALKIELEAVGDSGEQAALRWGLGLAHLQQALLFTSRYLRQQISQRK